MPLGAYHKFVKDDKDLAGKFAYCIYKEAKASHKKSFFVENNRYPTKDELNVFRNSICDNPKSLECYKERGKTLLENLLISSEITKVLSTILPEELKNYQNKNSFGVTLCYNILGGILTFVILLLFGVVAAQNKDTAIVKFIIEIFKG